MIEIVRVNNLVRLEVKENQLVKIQVSGKIEFKHKLLVIKINLALKSSKVHLETQKVSHNLHYTDKILMAELELEL